MNSETPTPGPRRRIVVALAVAAIGVVAFGAAVLAGSGSGTPSVAAQPAAGAAVAAVATDQGWVAPTALQHGRGGPGGWGMGGHGPMGGITITKIDGSKLSLTTADGWTRTIDASGATITRSGETIQVGALKVGDQITFAQSVQSDGTYKVTAITVVLPSVTGTVTSVDASSITVALGDGTTKKILVTSSTTYRVGDTAATRSAVIVGIRIRAEGSQASDGTFTASAVQVSPVTVSGTVATTSSSSFTITTRDGSTVTVKVTSSTTYEAKDVTSPSLSNVTVGASVAAQGTRNSDGSVTATVVRIGVAGGPGWGRGWGGGWSGDGWGGMMGPGMMNGGQGMDRGGRMWSWMNRQVPTTPGTNPSTDNQGG